MRIKIIIGLGLIVLCGFIGSLIHIGKGSGIVIGSIIGVILFCILITRPANRLWPFSSKANQQEQLTPDISQKDIEIATLRVREARINNEIQEYYRH